MTLHEKLKTAGNSCYFSDALSEEERIAAVFIGEIAASIQRQRKAQGYTQKELADKLRVSQAMVSRWENGEENFTAATLARISSALELPLHNPLHNEAI